MEGQLTEVIAGLKDDEIFLDQILVHMGIMYSALGKFDKSVLVCQRAISILEDKHGNFNLLCLWCCFRIGEQL